MSGMTFGEGVAVGMVSGDAMASRSSSNHYQREYESELAKRRALELENAHLKRLLAEKDKAHSDLHSIAVVNARKSSAGLVVMDSMVAAIKCLPKQLQDSFVSEVVQLSNNRFNALDEKFTLEAKKIGVKATTIRSVFSADPVYKKLGFERSM